MSKTPNMSCIFLRDDIVDGNVCFCVLPYRKNMTDEQIQQAVYNRLHHVVDGFGTYDHRGKALSTKRVLDEVIYHATTENQKFWEVMNSNYFTLTDIKTESFKNGVTLPTFWSNLEEVKKKLAWTS